METVRQQSDSASLALYCSNGTCEMRVGSHLALYAHYSRSVSSISDLFFFFLSVLSVILQYHSDDNISNNSSPASILEVRSSMTFIMTSLLIDVVVSVFQDEGSFLDGLTPTGANAAHQSDILNSHRGRICTTAPSGQD